MALPFVGVPSVAGAVSPVSPVSTGAPGSPGRMTRTEAKKQFKTAVDKLAEAVKLIPVYASQIAGLGRSEKMTIAYTDPSGQQRRYEIGRAEFREFVGQVVSELKRLPKLANDLYKTRRRVVKGAGFNAPQRFTQDIVRFFGQAEMGPIVTGQFRMKSTPTGEKRVPDAATLRPQEGTRLNQVLYFTQQQVAGNNNPLYGIISPGTLTPLFALHAYYAGMAIPGEAARLSASDLMRTDLAQVMRNAINADATKFKEKYPARAAEIDRTAAALTDSITSKARVNSKIPGVEGELFNPNYFPYAHFSKLNKAGRATGEGALSEAELANLGAQAAGVYGRMPQFTGLTPENAVIAVINAQQDAASLAGTYKNAQKAIIDRQRKAAERAAQRAAQAPAVPMAGLPGVGALPQVTGLPGFQGFPGTFAQTGLPTFTPR